MLLNNKYIKKIKLKLKKTTLNKKKSIIINILTIIQKKYKWISPELQKEIAKLINISPIHIREIISFYKMYNINYLYKYKISICNSLPCYLSGSKKIFFYFKKKLKILCDKKKILFYKKFFLLKSECMGLCGNAPIALINNKNIINKINKNKINLLIEKINYDLFS